MPFVDYDGTGEREYMCTAYTASVYEQEFRHPDTGKPRDLIADVMGRIDLRDAVTNFDDDGNLVVIDYTADDWNGELRAFWAMLKTAYVIRTREGKDVPEIGSFTDWCISCGPIDMQQISRLVWNETQKGLFRSGAAVSA